MSIAIHEEFYTFQGEGDHMGLPCYFIRTMGCPLKCSFCDSAGTWHNDYKPKESNKRTFHDLITSVQVNKATRIVLTGGEPALHDWEPFSRLARERIPRVHIAMETSGAFPISSGINWITLSPKVVRAPLEANLHRAHEFKLIITAPGDIEFWLDILQKTQCGNRSIWLHPEWSQRNNPMILEAISQAVMTSRFRLRAGYQIHKLYHVDQMSGQARSAVPLGGNPNNGY
jgi:7-carboxy-7-deazaguanine synthase